MRKNTQKITKPDTENVDVGTPFGTHVPPMSCQCAVFLRPGAWNLPVGDPRCDLYGILAGFGCHFGDIWDQCCDQMPIDPGSYSPCLAKASHGHTSTRIHKWGRRGREAL